MISAHCSNKAIIRERINTIDSTVAKINRSETILLIESQIVELIDGEIETKCWNYYFNDCAKMDIAKISISFNKYPGELCFYYEENKVIKREESNVINGIDRNKWSLYFDKDKEVFSNGLHDSVRGNEIEQAYYFQRIAFTYANEFGCR
jgi:hypothetical protein